MYKAAQILEELEVLASISLTTAQRTYDLDLNTLDYFVIDCICLLKLEPEDHAGAGEAQGGARETQIHRPGEESQAARADVCFRHEHVCWPAF